MRNLRSPTEIKPSRKSIRLYTHCCEGLVGLSAFYAFSTKGLLKIINRDIDPYATGHYDQGKFYLTTILDKEEILSHLVQKYNPSFVPVWSRSIFEDSFQEKLAKLAEKYPKYLEKVENVTKDISAWLKERNLKPSDIKGDILIELFHELENVVGNKDVLEYVKTAGIPYTISGFKGKQYKKLWYSPLWNKSLGRFGKGSIFNSFLSSLNDISKESWDAAIFGTPHQKVLGEYPTYQYDLKNWGGAREGKVDKKNYSLGIGVATGEKSLGTAADVLLLIESLTFFRGYLGEDYSQAGDDENVTVKKKPKFSLCVRNTSSSFHTGLMSEMSTSRAQKNLIGNEEIFVPIWSDPLTFNQAQERLSMTAEMPVETFINTSKDLMKHLALHASQTGIESYVRFSCVSRGGSGFSALHFLIPVEEYFPKRSRRNDIVSPLVPLYNEILYKLSRSSLPHTLKVACDSFVRSINDFSISRSTTQEIMYSFLGLADALKRTSAALGSGKLSTEYFSTFKLPSWWIDVLERRTESAELRIAKSISYGRQLCYFEDLSELVQGNLNRSLVSAYCAFIRFIDDPGDCEITSDIKTWMPMDYLVTFKFFSYKRYEMDAERNAWKFFIDNNDPVSALSIALDALNSRNLISSSPYPFVSTHRDDLELALKVPLSSQNQRRLRNQFY